MTERYTISDKFDTPSRRAIEEAIKASHLPEGVKVLSRSEIDGVVGAFIVVTHSPDIRDSVAALKKGALDYITFHLDAQVMTYEMDEAYRVRQKKNS